MNAETPYSYEGVANPTLQAQLEEFELVLPKSGSGFIRWTKIKEGRLLRPFSLTLEQTEHLMLEARNQGVIETFRISRIVITSSWPLAIEDTNLRVLGALAWGFKRVKDDTGEVTDLKTVVGVTRAGLGTHPLVEKVKDPDPTLVPGANSRFMKPHRLMEDKQATPVSQVRTYEGIKDVSLREALANFGHVTDGLIKRRDAIRITNHVLGLGVKGTSLMNSILQRRFIRTTRSPDGLNSYLEAEDVLLLFAICFLKRAKLEENVGFTNVSTLFENLVIALGEDPLAQRAKNSILTGSIALRNYTGNADILRS